MVLVPVQGQEKTDVSIQVVRTGRVPFYSASVFYSGL